MPQAAAAFHQTMAIEHRRDRAFGRNGDIREPAQQAFPDLTSTPAGVLTFHIQDVVLYLEGELMGIAIGASAPIGQPVNPALLVAIKDLVTGLARDPKLPAEISHRFAG